MSSRDARSHRMNVSKEDATEAVVVEVAVEIEEVVVVVACALRSFRGGIEESQAGETPASRA